MNDNDKEILDSYKKGETPASVLQNIQPSIKEIQKVQDEERYAIKAEILSDVLNSIVHAINYNSVLVKELSAAKLLECICRQLSIKIDAYREKSK